MKKPNPIQMDLFELVTSESIREFETPQDPKKINQEKKVEKQETKKEKIPPIKREVSGQNWYDFHSIPIPAIKIMALMIAIIAIIRSFGYVFAMFNTMDNPFMAALTAWMVVGSATVFPQAAILFWNGQKGVFSALIALSVLVMLLSMGATINALWADRSEVLARQHQESIESKSAATDLQISRDKKLRAEMDVPKLQKELDSLLAQRDKEEPLSAPYNRLEYRVADARKRLEENKKIISDAENQISLLYKKVDTSKRDDFLSTSGLELLFFIIMAVLVDLAGPVALAIALFLKENVDER